MLLFFAALLWGCGGSHDARIMAELDRADSLLRTSDAAMHDSVRQELEALDTARALRTDEMLRARHALLLVQARYKCYATQKADSALIDTAYRYYADHHSSSADHERYTRSLIYQGAVAEELGHPQQALQWYLEAEQAADPNDHFNLGYANMRMAVLLSSFYVSDGSDLEHYKRAFWHFSLSGERRYQGICLGNMGGILRITDNKAAKPYLHKGRQLMKEVGDSTYYYDFTEMLAMSHLLDSCYNEAGQLIQQCLESSKAFHKADFYFTAASLYVSKNNLDSARYLLSLSHQFPFSDRDSLMELRIRSSLSSKENNYRKTANLILSGDSIIEQIDLNINKRHITNVEKNHAINNLTRQKNLYHHVNSLLYLIFIVAVLLATWTFYNNHRTRKRVKKLVQDLRHERVNEHRELLTRIESYEEQIRNNSERIEDNEIRLKQLESLKTTLNRHIDLMKQLVKVTNSKTDRPDYVKKMTLNRMLLNNIGTSEFWKEIEFFANENYHGFVLAIRNQFKKLDEQEIRFLTLIRCGFTYGEIALIMNYSKDFISVKRSRIIEKMRLPVPFDDFLATFNN